MANLIPPVWGVAEGYSTGISNGGVRPTHLASIRTDRLVSPAGISAEQANVSLLSLTDQTGLALGVGLTLLLLLAVTYYIRKRAKFLEQHTGLQTADHNLTTLVDKSSQVTRKVIQSQVQKPHQTLACPTHSRAATCLPSLMRGRLGQLTPTYRGAEENCGSSKKNPFQ